MWQYVVVWFFFLSTFKTGKGYEPKISQILFMLVANDIRHDTEGCQMTSDIKSQKKTLMNFTANTLHLVPLVIPHIEPVRLNSSKSGSRHFDVMQI